MVLFANRFGILGPKGPSAGLARATRATAVSAEAVNALAVRSTRRLGAHLGQWIAHPLDIVNLEDTD